MRYKIIYSNIYKNIILNANAILLPLRVILLISDCLNEASCFNICIPLVESSDLEEMIVQSLPLRLLPSNLLPYNLIIL